MDNSVVDDTFVDDKSLDNNLSISIVLDSVFGIVDNSFWAISLCELPFGFSIRSMKYVLLSDFISIELISYELY